MKEIILAITPEVYTIEEAAKKLGTSTARRDFMRDHVKAGGLRLTILPGNKFRVSSIELARYIMSLTID